MCGIAGYIKRAAGKITKLLVGWIRASIDNNHYWPRSASGGEIMQGSGPEDEWYW
jgi:hypothetical protein